MTVGVKFYSITRSPQLEIAVTLEQVEVFRTPIDTPSDYCNLKEKCSQLYTRISLFISSRSLVPKSFAF